MRTPISIPCLGVMAMLATAGPGIVIDTYPQAAKAQTNGMERREDRRGTRQEARTDKHECNASGDSSRAGCRQEKRSDKQEGRQDQTGQPTNQPVPSQP